ncbi:MAG: electron transfer flavoprotein subunit beta/FixA family protein [Myxococcota bacterium]|nr:electron transfer flavoprotein subunit beta/FixA family protein [Myxococcota bacterium]
MKILIPMSRTEDPYAKILVRADGSDINRDNVAMVINPFDEIAVEEALRLREAGNEVEIVMVCIGGSEVEKEVRRALAMGADRAIRIDCSEELSPERVTPLLAPVVEKESPDLIIMGKQSIDGDSGQVPQRLAQRLNWPQATFASDLKVQDGKATVVREIDGGLETVAFDLPGIVSTDLRLNEPRLPKLPDIMKAKKKPFEVIGVDDIGGLPAQPVTVVHLAAPPEREAGQMVEDINELVAKLRDEAKVLS